MTHTTHLLALSLFSVTKKKVNKLVSICVRHILSLNSILYAVLLCYTSVTLTYYVLKGQQYKGNVFLLTILTNDVYDWHSISHTIHNTRVIDVLVAAIAIIASRSTALCLQLVIHYSTLPHTTLHCILLPFNTLHDYLLFYTT